MTMKPDWRLLREVKEMEIKEKLAKLIDLKSIITLALVATLIILVVKYGNENLMTTFVGMLSMVLTYYFTRKNKED